ncbi:hypothetical protein [Paraburkholderia xenovorans]
MLVSWFLNGNRACVQTELDRFFAALRNQAELVCRARARRPFQNPPESAAYGVPI